MQPEWSKINLRDKKSESRRKKDYNPSMRKSKHYKNSEGRLVNTRAYAIAWGVINKPYSLKDLINKCKDPEAPSYRYIIQQQWKGFTRYYNDLVKAGMEPRPPRTDEQKRIMIGKASNDGFRKGLLDKDYDIARIAAEYGVTTRESYNQIRKQKPESKMFLPNIRTIYKRYGSWSRFAYQVMKYNADLVITEYVRQSAECGHWLKLSECDKLKIPIRGIMDILRPTIFNALCYKKLTLMGFDKLNQQEIK